MDQVDEILLIYIVTLVKSELTQRLKYPVMPAADIKSGNIP
jgi:hypothetical protein